MSAHTTNGQGDRRRESSRRRSAAWLRRQAEDPDRWARLLKKQRERRRARRLDRVAAELASVLSPQEAQPAGWVARTLDEFARVKPPCGSLAGEELPSATAALHMLRDMLLRAPEHRLPTALASQMLEVTKREVGTLARICLYIGLTGASGKPLLTPQVTAAHAMGVCMSAFTGALREVRRCMRACE